MENVIKAVNNAYIAGVIIKRADLADVLKALKFKQGKHAIPILNYCLLEVTRGAVVFKATDLESAVSYKVNALTNTTAAGARFCLNLAALESAIKGAPKKGEITINYTGAEAKASITWPELAGGAFPIPSQFAVDFPMIPEVSMEKTEGLRAFVEYKDMPALVAALAFSASAEDDRHVLNGIYFDGKEAATTDSRRLAVLPFAFTFTPAAKEKGVIIPTATIKRAAKLTPAGLMQIYGNAVYFSNSKGVTITSRIIEGNFPAYHQIIPKTFSSIATLDGAALLPVLLSIPEVRKGRAAVTFLFTGAGYELYNKCEKIAAFPLIEGAAEFKKKYLKISFNPCFVLDILEAAPGNVQIRLNNETTPAILYNGTGAECLIMPLRTEGSAGGLGARLAALDAAAALANQETADRRADKAAEINAAQKRAAAVQDAPAPAPEPVQDAAEAAPIPSRIKVLINVLERSAIFINAGEIVDTAAGWKIERATEPGALVVTNCSGFAFRLSEGIYEILSPAPALDCKTCSKRDNLRACAVCGNNVKPAEAAQVQEAAPAIASAAEERAEEIAEKEAEILELAEAVKELEARAGVLESGDDTAAYDDALDESGPVKIGNLEYTASRVLKDVDPTAYRCGLNDYNDAELSEIERDIDDKNADIKALQADIKELQDAGNVTESK